MARTLQEILADKPSLNAEINQLLRQFDRDEHTQVVDALDAVKMAGPQGLPVAEWAAQLRLMHPEISDPMGLLKRVAKAFAVVIKRVGDRRYGWDESGQDTGQDDPHVAQMLQSQVGLASLGMDLMRTLGQFSLDQLADRMAARSGMPPAAARHYAQHLIDQWLGSMVLKLGDDRYSFKPETHKTAGQHVSDIKDLLRKAGLGPQTPDR